jgi:hypothetical protein
MATTTATLTLSSADLTGDALSLSTTATLTKAGTATGMDQTTGVSRKLFGTAVTDYLLIDGSDYNPATAGAVNKAHKVYLKNLSTTAAEYVTITVSNNDATSSDNIDLGLLYAGDFAFFPYDGFNDILVTTSANNMSIEFMVIYED